MEKARTNDMPPELSMYVPRAVRLSGGGKAVVCIAVGLAIAGLVVPALLWADRERKAGLRARIEREGVRAEAEVVRTGKTREDHPRRFADYRYGGRGGRVVFSGKDRREFKPGDAIQIRYLPAEPDKRWVVGYEPRGAPAGALAAVGLSLWLGAALIAVGLRKQWRMLAEGRATIGRIVGIKKSKDSQGRNSYRVEYEIQLLSGAVRRIWSAGDKRSAEGARVAVLYDPENPKRLARYPLSLVRVARDG